MGKHGRKMTARERRVNRTRDVQSHTARGVVSVDLVMATDRGCVAMWTVRGIGRGRRMTLADICWPDVRPEHDGR